MLSGDFYYRKNKNLAIICSIFTKPSKEEVVIDDVMMRQDAHLELRQHFLFVLL